MQTLACAARFFVGWLWSFGISIFGLFMACVVGPQRMWLFVAPLWARVLMRIVKVRVNVIGMEHLPPGRKIFIANHESLIDVVMYPAILPPNTKYVAKRELLLVPFWGLTFALGGAILVQRRRPKAALQQLSRGVQRLPPGWSTIVFPEGHRSRDGTLQPFKRGAFYAARENRTTIVPLGAYGARHIVPTNGWLLHPGVVHVCVGPPIETAQWPAGDLTPHIQQCHDAVQACIDTARASAKVQG